MMDDLIKLAKELYAEGYQCGISGSDADMWFKAWAIAMEMVVKGERYTEGMVAEIFKGDVRREA